MHFCPYKLSTESYNYALRYEDITQYS